MPTPWIMLLAASESRQTVAWTGASVGRCDRHPRPCALERRVTTFRHRRRTLATNSHPQTSVIILYVHKDDCHESGIYSALLYYCMPLASNAIQWLKWQTAAKGQYEAPKAPRSRCRRCRAGCRMKKEVSPSPSDCGVWGSVVSCPSGVRGRAPAENEFGAFCLLQNPSGGRKTQFIYLLYGLYTR